MTDGGRLPRLTSLRWFAALAVFACHYGYRDTWRWLIPGGAVGVGFFFVLSGIVLAWSAPIQDTARALWLRRFARIYPATAASVLIAVAIRGVYGEQPVGPGSYAASLTLSQAWLPNPSGVSQGVNPVTWSLSCEAFFYLLLPVLLVGAARLRGRQITVAAAVGLAAGLAVSVLLMRHGLGFYAYRCPLVRLPEFTAGVAIGVMLRRGWRPRATVAPAVLLLAVGVALGEFRTEQIQVYLALPGVVLLLLAMAGRDLAGRPGLLTRRWLVYLGEVSFCFYLLHKLALDHVGGRLFPPLALAVAASVALHHGAELPMQRRILRRRRIAVGAAARHRLGGAVDDLDPADTGREDLEVWPAGGVAGVAAHLVPADTEAIPGDLADQLADEYRILAQRVGITDGRS